MNKRERVRAAFRREPVDRVPIALWRHFPVADQTAAGLAEAVLAFQRQHDFDLVKVTPASDYMVVDWGLKGEYRGSAEGVREVTERPIQSVADWERLRPLDPGQGSLGKQLDSLRLIGRDLAGEAPYLQTIFSPLSTARKIGGERWREDLRSHPHVLHSALGVIAATTASFARESRRAGADGIFFATQTASRALVSEEEYHEFGERYDRQVLAAVAGESDVNVLHLHGEQIMFDLAAGYPVAAVNWHDRRTTPSLREAPGRFPGGLIGGLNELATLLYGTPQEVAAEVADAIAQTGGRGLMVGAGCVIRIDTPEQSIKAALSAARGSG